MNKTSHKIHFTKKTNKQNKNGDSLFILVKGHRKKLIRRRVMGLKYN